MSEIAPVGPGEAFVLGRIGIVDPDLGDPFHAGLLAAVRRVGPGQSQGSYLSALRFQIVQEHLLAGRVYAEERAQYERAKSRHIVKAMNEPRSEGSPRMSLGLAEHMAETDDGLYERKLRFLVAEKREQTMRKFLDAIEGALDNHRTDRADQRAADRASAQGLTGGA